MLLKNLQTFFLFCKKLNCPFELSRFLFSIGQFHSVQRMSTDFSRIEKSKRISRITAKRGSDQRLVRFDQVIAVTQYPQVKLRFFGACRTRRRCTLGEQVSDNAWLLLLARGAINFLFILFFVSGRYIFFFCST